MRYCRQVGGVARVVVLGLGVAIACVVLTVDLGTAASVRPRVILVTQPCDELSFICPAFKRALRETGIEGRIVAPDPREDSIGTLSRIASQGYGMVIVDAGFGEALSKVAQRYPHAHFALIDVPLLTLRGLFPDNVQGVLLRPNQAAYLAGWLAARLERRRPGRDVVSVVAGGRFPPVDDFIVGFRAGARGAEPKIRVLVDYSNDFTDPTKCGAIARSQIARGSGVVFDVAGACGVGALEAAKERGVWGIGVDQDQSALGAHIMTSVVKRYDAGFILLLRQVRNGRFRASGVTQLALRQGGADLGRVSPRVPRALLAQLAKVRQSIVEGRIRVPGASF